MPILNNGETAILKTKISCPFQPERRSQFVNSSRIVFPPKHLTRLVSNIGEYRAYTASLMIQSNK